jgi:hypothetical protein
MINTFRIVFRAFPETAMGFETRNLRENLSNYNNSLQLKAINTLAFMAHKCTDERRFIEIIQILT